jgi:hypothetical protein
MDCVHAHWGEATTRARMHKAVIFIVTPEVLLSLAEPER